MGCGSTKIFVTQMEIIQSLKCEKIKSEEEIKKLYLEKEKSVTLQVQSEIRKLDEIDKHLEGYKKFQNGLNDILEVFQINEYYELEKLEDLLEVFYTFPSSNCFDEIPDQLDKINNFLSENSKIKKNQKEIINDIENELIKLNEFFKTNNIDFNHPDNDCLKLYFSLYSKILENLKTVQYVNLNKLTIHLDLYNKSKNSKNNEIIQSYFQSTIKFLESNRQHAK